MNKIERLCPAKINIGLNIIEKRNDGYHNLETIFYPIKLADKITIKVSNTSSFESNDERISSDKDNLILKTKRIVENEAGKSLNCKINLAKKIPIGAGLGGGSSNAATTMMILNDLFSLEFGFETLNRLAIQLGSDVPFFLNPVPSIGTSRGEILRQIYLSITDPILIVNPGIHISTKWAYENITPKRSNQISEINIKGNIFDELSNLSNDFETIVFDKFPEILKIKTDMLANGAYYASMSGSGSTVFGIFKSHDDVKLIEKEFSKKYFTYLELHK